ncbi:MAG: hypothetical protein E6R08_00735 [Nevskiaceae bacterium]|nr:MAG: hypothetical protein E6R08_00735 [Nevskiaceae bacterium]
MNWLCWRAVTCFLIGERPQSPGRVDVLVDVVELRRFGSKRPEEEVKTAAPVRGLLQYDVCLHLRRISDARRPMMAQLIAPGTSIGMLRPLLCIEPGPLRDWEFVVSGREDHGDVRTPVRAGPRQAWWCRIVR